MRVAPVEIITARPATRPAAGEPLPATELLRHLRELAEREGYQDDVASALPVVLDEPPTPPSPPVPLVAVVGAVDPAQPGDVPPLVTRRAGVVGSAADRAALERRVRCLSGPPLSLGRLSLRDDDAIVHRLQPPDRCGRTALVMTPLEILARLAALLPAPRLCLRRLLGVFAAASPDHPIALRGSVCAD